MHLGGNRSWVPLISAAIPEHHYYCRKAKESTSSSHRVFTFTTKVTERTLFIYISKEFLVL